MKRFSLRMAAVDTPIIPAVAALVVNNPGTISLGQGVVNYGPPAEAIAALPGLMGDVQLNKYQAVMGYPALVDALRQKLAQENGIHAGSDAMVMVTAGSNMAFLNCVLAVGDPGDGKVREHDRTFARIDHDEIITEAVHLGERQGGRKSRHAGYIGASGGLRPSGAVRAWLSGTRNG